jgi:hypothetical protein
MSRDQRDRTQARAVETAPASRPGADRCDSFSRLANLGAVARQLLLQERAATATRTRRLQGARGLRRPPRRSTDARQRLRRLRRKEAVGRRPGLPLPPRGSPRDSDEERLKPLGGGGLRPGRFEVLRVNRSARIGPPAVGTGRVRGVAVRLGMGDRETPAVRGLVRGRGARGPVRAERLGLVALRGLDAGGAARDALGRDARGGLEVITGRLAA